MLENLGAIQTAIHRGDDKHAIAILEGLRDSSFGNQLIQTQIDLVRSGQLRTVGDWLEDCIEKHSEAGFVEVDEEISINLGSAVAGFQISESDFNPTESLSNLFNDQPSTKRDKLKAKLAGLRTASEAEESEAREKPLPDVGFFAKKSDNDDPFADLMEPSDVEIENTFRANSSTKVSEQERDREYTPIAPAAIQDILPSHSLSEKSSDAKYRGEPRLREHSSGITANRGFSRDDKTGVDSAISFIVEEPLQPVTNLGAIRLEAKRLFRTGELDAALDITKKILSRNEDEITATLRVAILQAIEERDLELIGELTYVPRLNVAPNELANYVLDHKAGYLLSMIDGMLTYEDLVDLSGMPREATLQIIAALLKQQIIS